MLVMLAGFCTGPGHIHTDRHSTTHIFLVNVTDVFVIANFVFLCNVINVGGPNLCGVNCVH